MPKIIYDPNRKLADVSDLSRPQIEQLIAAIGNVRQKRLLDSIRQREKAWEPAHNALSLAVDYGSATDGEIAGAIVLDEFHEKGWLEEPAATVFNLFEGGEEEFRARAAREFAADQLARQKYEQETLEEIASLNGTFPAGLFLKTESYKSDTHTDTGEERTVDDCRRFINEPAEKDLVVSRYKKWIVARTIIPYSQYRPNMTPDDDKRTVYESRILNIAMGFDLNSHHIMGTFNTEIIKTREVTTRTVIDIVVRSEPYREDYVYLEDRKQYLKVIKDIATPSE